LLSLESRQRDAHLAVELEAADAGTVSGTGGDDDVRTPRVVDLDTLRRENTQQQVVGQTRQVRAVEHDLVLVGQDRRTALKREGCTTIRSEKRSGTTTHGREELRTVLDFLRKGDVLILLKWHSLSAAPIVHRYTFASEALP
jgi:hypothetical protein